MRRFALLLGCAVLAACGVGGPVQSPEKQAVADDMHERIMRVFADRDHAKGHSATAACITWDNARPVAVSGIQSYYLPARSAVYKNPMNDLRFEALRDCGEDRNPAHDCTCGIVDENGVNMIAVP